MRSRLEGWDAHIAGFPETTFYHTRVWAEILLRAFPGLRDESYWLETEGGRAAVPLFTWRRLGGLLTTRHSSFPFLYGGPVPRRLAQRDLLTELLARQGQGGASLVVVTNPFAPGEAKPLPSVSVTEDATHLLRLPSDYERFWDHVLTTSKRNDVRRCTRKGVIIRTGRSEEEVATLYRFYRESFARWGARPKLVYPEALYQAMIHLGGENVRLYIAEHEGKIIGGAFVPRWNEHVHYHAGYFDHAARALRPNVLIQERIIRDAIAERFCDYDFLPSGGNRGVETFKEGFGGVRTLIRRYEYRSPTHRWIDRLRRRHA